MEKNIALSPVFKLISSIGNTKSFKNAQGLAKTL